MIRLILLPLIFVQPSFANPSLDGEIEKYVADFCLLVMAFEDDLNATYSYTDEELLDLMKKKHPDFVTDMIRAVKPFVINQDYTTRLFLYRQASNSCGESLEYQ